MSALESPEKDSSLNILQDFHQIYQQRLDQLKHLHGDSTEVQMKTLHDWVRDLTEQNNLLVQTVEELEKEALERVKMLDEITRTSDKNNLQLHELAENSLRMSEMESLVGTLQCQLKEKEAMICDYVQKLKKYEKTIKILKEGVKSETSWSESRADTLDFIRGIESKKNSLDERNSTRLRYFDSDPSNSQCEMDNNMKSGSCEVTLLESKVSFLEESLREKEYEAENHLRKIGQLQEYIDRRELCNLSNTKVDASSMTEICDLTPLSKMEERLKLKEEEAERLRSHIQTAHSHDQQILALRENILHLQRASRDVQSALTAEVAEKHDAIVALRRETAQLEEQLRQSDMQTHFKDDIIKQLRKEVKLARAKDSLAEMLGLKECPRVQMKEKIEKLSAELEEREVVISRLEGRLERSQVEALEENILKLGSQLSSRERDLLTLCNKMDYVRRYVKRLRDDEDLSVKCGLEALLHELNEDSEWNKETRKSVTSLTEGVPNDVIVINRVPARSHSLPSDTHSPLHLHHHKHQPPSNWNEKLLNLEQDEVDKLRELQNELEHNRAHLTKLWKEIKTMTMEVSNNTIYNDLEEFKEETKGHQEMLAQIMCDLEKLVQSESQKDIGKGEYLVSCIEANLSGMIKLLNMESARPDNTSYDSRCSDSDLFTITDSLAGNIKESLSYIRDMRDSYQEMREEEKARKEGSDILKELLLILSDIIDSKQRTLQKISHIQKIQGESYCRFSTKFREFDKAYTSHAKTEHAISKELSKIICRATYEQPQGSHEGWRGRDGTMSPLRKARTQLKTLKQALSARENEIMKKDRTICILKKSLSQKSLVKTSQSAPLPGSSSLVLEYDSDPMSNFDEKVTQAQEVVNQVRRQMEQAMCNLLSREEKLCDVEKDMMELRRTLNSVLVDVNDINQSVKDLRECTEEPNAKKKLDAPLKQLELEVNRLISKLQHFAREKEYLERTRVESQRGIATLQSDLSNIQVDLGESVKEIKMQMPINLFTFPSAKAADETIIENLRCQLDIYKQKVERLEEDLMMSPYCGGGHHPPSNPHDSVWVECLVDAGLTLDNTQQQIQEIQEDMRNSLDEALSCNFHDTDYPNDSGDLSGEIDLWKKKFCDLQKEHEQRLQTIRNQEETMRLLEENLERLQCEASEMRKQIETIRWEKESVETENQQAMQELQAKISSLQAELQSGSTNTGSSCHLYIIIEDLLAEYAKCYKEAVGRRSECLMLRDANLELCLEGGRLKARYDSLRESLLKPSLKHEKELERLREAMRRSEVDAAFHKKQIKELSNMVRELKEHLSGDKQNEDINLKEALQRLEGFNLDLRGEKELLENQLEQERKTIALHSHQMAAIKNDLIAKTSECKKLEKVVRENKETLDELSSENTNLLEKNEGLECLVKELKEEMDEARKEQVNLTSGYLHNCQYIYTLKADFENALEEVKKENCELRREKEGMRTEYEARLKALQNQILSVEEKNFKMAYNEAKAQDLISQQKGTICRLKEGADYLSGKVAQLSIFVDEKEKTVALLESQLKQLSEKCEESEEELKMGKERVSKVEVMLESMEGKVDTLQSIITKLQRTNDQLTREKCGLEEWVMERWGGESPQSDSSLLPKADLASTCRAYKKKLNKTLDQNKCLMRMVHNLKVMNGLLRREVRGHPYQQHSTISSEESGQVRTKICFEFEKAPVSHQ